VLKTHLIAPVRLTERPASLRQFSHHLTNCLCQAAQQIVMYSVLLFPISALYGVLGLLLRILSAFLVPSIGEPFFSICSLSAVSVRCLWFSHYQRFQYVMMDCSLEAVICRIHSLARRHSTQFYFLVLLVILTEAEALSWDCKIPMMVFILLLVPDAVPCLAQRRTSMPV
jgi:hypothetical protein